MKLTAKRNETISRLTAILAREFEVDNNLIEHVEDVVDSTWKKRNVKNHSKYEWQCLQEVYTNII